MIGRSKRSTRRAHCALLAAIAVTATLHPAHAQLSVTGDSSYLIDFDATVPGVNNGTWFALGFDPGATQVGRLDSNAWSVSGWSYGPLPFGGTQTTPSTDYVRTATTSAVSSSGFYAFGISGAGRTLGIQQGVNDWDPGTLTLRVKNDSTQSILAFDFSSKLWVRNDQNRSSIVTMSASQDDSTYTNLSGTNTAYTTPGFSDSLGFKSVDVSASLSGLSIAPGAYAYLRWSGGSSGASGARDEIAFDDITLNHFIFGTPPNDLHWNSFPSGAWNTTAGNQPWLRNGSASAFVAGDNAIFDDPTGPTTITIDPAGVQPGGIVVSNSSNAYTFAGGPIHGGVTVVKNNAGAVILSNPNGWTGPLIVNAGSIVLAANGGSAGVMKITGALTLSTANGARLDIANNHLILSSATPTGTWNGTTYTGVTGWIASGRSGNTWTGAGIVTSQTLAIGSNYATIAVARASDVRPTTATETALWSGQTITGSDTLVMYTYGGDATLDGKLNIDDYIRIDNGIATGLTGWSNGDFNYDGKVSIDDYITVIDANIGIQSGVFYTSGSAVTAVPEPVISAVGLAPVLYGLLRRRRLHRPPPPRRMITLLVAVIR